jgi:hypothetical protein
VTLKVTGLLRHHAGNAKDKRNKAGNRAIDPASSPEFRHLPPHAAPRFFAASRNSYSFSERKALGAFASLPLGRMLVRSEALAQGMPAPLRFIGVYHANGVAESEKPTGPCTPTAPLHTFEIPPSDSCVTRTRPWGTSRRPQ